MSASDIKAGEAYVEIAARTTALQAGLRNSEADLVRFTRRAGNIRIIDIGTAMPVGLAGNLQKSESLLTAWADKAKKIVASALVMGGALAGAGALALGGLGTAAMAGLGAVGGGAAAAFSKPKAEEPLTPRGAELRTWSQQARKEQVAAGVQSRRYAENEALAKAVGGAAWTGKIATRVAWHGAGDIGTALTSKSTNMLSTATSRAGVAAARAVGYAGNFFTSASKSIRSISRGLGQVETYFGKTLAGKYAGIKREKQQTFAQKTEESFLLGGQKGGAYNWFGQRRLAKMPNRKALEEEASRQTGRYMQRSETVGLLTPEVRRGVSTRIGIEGGGPAGTLPVVASGGRGGKSARGGGAARLGAAAMGGAGAAMLAGNALHPEQAEKASVRIQDSLDRIRNRSLIASAALSAAGMAILAPLTLSVDVFTEYGDSIAKMGQRTGLTATEVSELAHVASLSGTDMQSLEKGVKGMQKTLFEAASGSKEAKETLSLLGLSIKDLAGKSTADQFGIFADKMAGIQDPASKAALAMKVFGKSGTELIPMLDLGAKGMAAAREDAKRLGLTLTGEAAASASRLDDQLNRTWGVVKGLHLAIGATLAPTVARLANGFIAAAGMVRQFINDHKPLVILAAQIGAGFLLAAGALAAVSLAATGFSIIVSGLGVAMAALPFMAMIAAVAGVALGFAMLGDAILSSFGIANLGLVDFVSAIRVGGNSIGAWMQVIWLNIFKGWEAAQEGILGGWNSLVLSVEEVGAVIYRSLLAVANGISQAFWSAIQGVLEAFKWLADKAITSGYELHLLDDKDLAKGMQALQALSKGPEDFIKRQKDQASNVYGGLSDDSAKASQQRWSEYYRSVQGKSKDTEARLKELDQAIAAVFANDNAADPFAGLMDKGKAKIDELRAKFAALTKDAESGEGAGKPPITPGLDLASMEAKTSASKVLGSFSGSAISGAGFGPLAKKQDEANKWLKQIAKNTAQPAVGVLG